jgi:hypothetical protein
MSRASSVSELYGYDGLDRLRSFQRGELNGAGDAIIADPPAGSLKSQSWTDLDRNGNWLEWQGEIQRDGSIDALHETRSITAVNELETRYLSAGSRGHSPAGAAGASARGSMSR